MKGKCEDMRKILLTPPFKAGLIGIFSGVILVSFCSILQRIILGVDPFVFKGFIFPILVGASAGGVIGKLFSVILQINKQLQQRLDTLETFLPICSNCKKIRKPDSDPKKMDSWEQIESYISKKTSSQFSHSICPECIKKLYGDIMDENQ